MQDTKRKPLQWFGHVLAQVLVGIYVTFDSILGPIFRPFMRWLSRLRPVQAIEASIAACPAYVVLGLLAVPFAVEEFAKVYAFVLMGGGHFKTGLTLYIGAHVFAILVCERIFSVGKDKLLTIGWFARLFRWLEGYKDRLVAWNKSTAVYRRAAELKAELREKIRGVLRRRSVTR